jgi:hypothetical protein
MDEKIDIGIKPRLFSETFKNNDHILNIRTRNPYKQSCDMKLHLNSNTFGLDLKEKIQ